MGNHEMLQRGPEYPTSKHSWCQSAPSQQCAQTSWASMKYRSAAQIHPEAAPAMMMWVARATQVLSATLTISPPSQPACARIGRQLIARNTIARRSSSNCMISLPSPAAMASKHGSKVMPEPVVTRHCSPAGDVMPLWQTHGSKRHTAKWKATRRASLA
jgi:hypothetical protein